MGPCSVNLPQATRIGTVGTTARLLAPPGRRREIWSRASAPSRIPQQPRGHGRGLHRRRLAAHRIGLPKGHRRRGLPAITGRKHGDHRHRRGESPRPSGDRLRGHPLVSQVLVVGENRPASVRCSPWMRRCCHWLSPTAWRGDDGCRRRTGPAGARRPRRPGPTRRSHGRSRSAPSRCPRTSPWPTADPCQGTPRRGGEALLGRDRGFSTRARRSSQAPPSHRRRTEGHREPTARRLLRAILLSPQRLVSLQSPRTT